MRTRAQILAILLCSVLFLGIHFDFKRDFDPEALRQFAEQIAGPASWYQKVAPDFEGSTLDGGRFRLADQIGTKIVILNFFATWCGPCRQELPELNRFRNSELGHSVLFVGIDAAEERPEVQKFVREYSIEFPVIIDHPGGIRKKYGVQSYPTTVVIGADGRVQLYETNAIMNADVSLAATVRTAAERLRSGGAATREAYLEAAGRENYRGAVPASSPKQRGADLSGRARAIAEKMSCLCGCTNKLLDCECKTATGMKRKLREGALDSQTDEQVMLSLGKEFCMGGM